MGVIRNSGGSTMKAMIILSFLLGTPLRGEHRTYYVSPDGVDAHTGFTIDTPLKSINEALRRAVAGDTVYLLPGTYRELISVSGKKGIPENPICLMGLSTDVDAYPVIDGGAAQPSSSDSHDWIHISKSDWIEIARMAFKNGWTFPIQVSRSSYLTFRSCRFWGGKRVINASGASTHHILVEDCYWDQGGNYLWRIVTDTAGVPAWTSMHHGAMAYFNGSLFDFSGTSGSMVIRRNRVVNAFQAVRYRGRKGYDSNVEIYENHVSNMRDNDFEPEYYTYNLHIYHNVSHNVHRTLSVDNVEGGQIYYYGNVITADTDAWSMNICAGIWKVFGRRNDLSLPVYAFNNSFYVPGIAFQHVPDKVKHLKHWNNAYFFLKSGGWGLARWDSTNEFDYDVSNKMWPSVLVANGQEAHGIVADISFTDPGHGNLTLQAGSKGTDAGKIVSLREYDWTQTFSGRAPDVGAYEGEKLVDGPPFRFMPVPGAAIAYKEKPRIVRYKTDGRNVLVDFSAEIDPSSVRKENIGLYARGKELSIRSVSLSGQNYRLLIETDAIPIPADLAISFTKWPGGTNGELATSWASAMNIRKQSKGTEVQ